MRMYINVKKVERLEPINGGLEIWMQIKIRVQSYASNYWLCSICCEMSLKNWQRTFSM